MDEFTPEELEQARILFARPATFVMGCAKIEQLPDPDLPERQVVENASSTCSMVSPAMATTSKRHARSHSFFTCR